MMQTKNNILIKLIIAISLLANLAMGVLLFTQNRQEDNALAPLSLWLIQGKIGQLERAIDHQQSVGWANPSHVAEKIDDVVQGISVTIEARKSLKKLSKNDEELLWLLHERLSRLPHSSLGYGMQYTEEEKLVLARLGDQIRMAGWSDGVSFTSSTEQVMERIAILLQKL